MFRLKVSAIASSGKKLICECYSIHLQSASDQQQGSCTYLTNVYIFIRFYLSESPCQVIFVDDGSFQLGKPTSYKLVKHQFRMLSIRTWRSPYLKMPNPFFLVFFSVSSTESSDFFLPLVFFSFFFLSSFFFFFFPSSASRSWRDELLAGVSWPELCSDMSSSDEGKQFPRIG